MMIAKNELFDDFPTEIVSVHHHCDEITIYSRLEFFTTITIVYEGGEFPLIEIYVDGVSGEFDRYGRLKFTNREHTDELSWDIEVEVIADKNGITYLLISHKRINNGEIQHESFVEFDRSEGWTYNPRYEDKDKK